MSRFDASDTVITRAAWCVADPHLRPRVGVAEPARQVLRETAGGCSRGSSRPSGTASAAAARSAARGRAPPPSRRRSIGSANCSATEYAPGRLDDRAEPRAQLLDRVAVAARGRRRRTRWRCPAAPAGAAGCARRCRCRSRGACARRWLCASVSYPASSSAASQLALAAQVQRQQRARTADGASRRTRGGSRGRPLARLGLRRARSAAQVRDRPPPA